MLASHSLLLLGVPLNRVLTRIRAIREERYSLFRGFFHGATDAADAAENLQPRLHSVLLPGRARAIGRPLAELELDGLVEVTGVRRRGARSQRPGPDWVFEAGDVVVLLGRPENLALAEQTAAEGLSRAPSERTRGRGTLRTPGSTGYNRTDPRHRPGRGSVPPIPPYERRRTRHGHRPPPPDIAVELDDVTFGYDHARRSSTASR